MRDTEYATELGTASIDFSDGSEGRIEKLFVKSFAQEEIRLSWWKDNRLMMRPLDLAEKALIQLLANGIRGGVLSDRFLQQLQHSVQSGK